MKTLENTIETVEIGKYKFTIYKRENPTRYVNKPFAVVYEKATPKGKYFKTKVIEHYVYESLEACEEYITKLYGAIYKRNKAEALRKKELAEERKKLKASDYYEVGDILYNSWGYEQTNIEFYQVVSMTAKTIKVREIAQEMEEGSMERHGMAHNVLGLKDSFLEGGREYKLRVKPKGYLSSPESYYYFSKWDGESKYTSSYY